MLLVHPARFLSALLGQANAAFLVLDGGEGSSAQDRVNCTVNPFYRQGGNVAFGVLVEEESFRIQFCSATTGQCCFLNPNIIKQDLVIALDLIYPRGVYLAVMKYNNKMSSREVYFKDRLSAKIFEMISRMHLRL